MKSRMDDEGKVKDVLEQCSDEAALQLFAADCAAQVEGDLLARFQRLKEGGGGGGGGGGRGGGHVASQRLDASQSLAMPPSQAAAASPKLTSAASDVDKLLETVSDQVRLEKLTSPSARNCGHDQTFHSSEEESSDSEVDKIIEWAKDAAALDSQQETEDHSVFVPTVPRETDPKNKRKASRWKLW